MERWRFLAISLFNNTYKSNNYGWVQKATDQISRKIYWHYFEYCMYIWNCRVASVVVCCFFFAFRHWILSAENVSASWQHFCPYNTEWISFWLLQCIFFLLPLRFSFRAFQALFFFDGCFNAVLMNKFQYGKIHMGNLLSYVKTINLGNNMVFVLAVKAAVRLKRKEKRRTGLTFVLNCTMHSA